VGEDDLFAGIEELDPFRHEPDASQNDGLLGNLLGANTELERITLDIGDLEDLGGLVGMGDETDPLLFFQGDDFILQFTNHGCSS